MPDRAAGGSRGAFPGAAPFILLWAAVLVVGATGVVALGRYGAHLVALGFLYAAVATSWSGMRAIGLFSLGQAAFFGAGALTQSWLVTQTAIPPVAALLASALAGGLVALPLVFALRLSAPGFALASLAWATLMKGAVANVRAIGAEGFLLPRTNGFDGGAPAVIASSIALALAASAVLEAFLRRPAGRAAAALRQQPETAASLGIDPVRERWRFLTWNAAVAGASGGVYAHLVGSVDAGAVLSPIFSVIPLVLAAAGGALHPLGGLVGTLVLYPLDELVFRPTLPHAHTLLYGVALIALLLWRPQGLLGPRAAGFGLSAAAGLSASRAPLPVAVSAVAVHRGGRPVLTDVSFVLDSGELLRITGPNGAGKTSLLLAIAGTLPVANGTITFGGARARRNVASRARMGVARTFQAPRPFPEWTVRQNVALAAERAGNLQSVEPLLEELELASLADRPAAQLSVGEGKRLEIARALACRPSVLLLDEPLAGLAPDAARRVFERVDRTRREGVGVLWVEHGARRVNPADRLLVLEGGRARLPDSSATLAAECLEPPS